MSEPVTPVAILVVDDEPDSLETLRMLLREEGFDARGASSAAEALNLIRVSRPDLMIVDIMMPGMSGLDLCEYLRGRAATRDIPIIAYSGYPIAQHSNSDLYERTFLKPVDIGELVLAIRALLARRP